MVVYKNCLSLMYFRLRPKPNVELCTRRARNLGRPELSKDRLLGQTSNLGRVKPISINILLKEKVQVKP